MVFRDYGLSQKEPLEETSTPGDPRRTAELQIIDTSPRRQLRLWPSVLRGCKRITPRIDLLRFVMK
jgi:hypothetical protein